MLFNCYIDFLDSSFPNSKFQRRERGQARTYSGEEKCKCDTESQFVCPRSARVENSGNKLKDFAAERGVIIGGKDTCQGDSGGPLWVEEDGKVE